MGTCSFVQALETLIIYVGNLQRNPDDKRYRKILISNIHFQERLGVIEGAWSAQRVLLSSIQKSQLGWRHVIWVHVATASDLKL